ncbi:hypothetical protein FBU30_001811, partial [Linnemannia zychae]
MSMQPSEDPTDLPIDQIDISDNTHLSHHSATPSSPIVVDDALESASAGTHLLATAENEDVVMSDHTSEKSDITPHHLHETSSPAPMASLSRATTPGSTSALDPHRFSILRYASKIEDPTKNLVNVLRSKREQY